MSRRGMLVGGLAVVGGLGWLVWAVGQSPEPVVRTEPDVTFARPGDETLKLDMALPAKGDGPFPAVVCLHGGGWVGGSRKQLTGTIDVLAKQGYVAVAPDYRVAPKHPWPACVEDCKAAVRWLRANAGTYRIDPDRIGVVGLSAGGHLACMLGVTDPSDGLEGTGGHADKSSAVRVVVSFSGPTDLTAEELWTDEVLSKNLKPLFGGGPAEKRDLYRQASPVHYAPKRPPAMLLVHGAQDKSVPARQAGALADKVRGLGGSVKVLVLDDAGHTWAGRNLTYSIDQMLTFLDEALAGKRRPPIEERGGDK